ncbi:MAG: helix-turn-helix transcriptional regulator [Pseudomonadota bacterium]|nr:helix-turn-helix transcriptional regulator [Pseudomonadota bacterium]
MKPFQMRAARAILRLGVREVAEAAGVTPATITRFETEKGGLQMASIDKLRAFYESQGVMFIEANGEGPGVRMRKEHHD